MVCSCGSLVVRANFLSEAGEKVVPVSASWSLYDGNGEIVNSREDIAIVPAEDMYIALHGNDILTGETREDNMRVLVTNGLYASSLTGENLPVCERISFTVCNGG